MSFNSEGVLLTDSELSASGSTEHVATLALRKIIDSRPDISSVGVKKNAWGMSMGEVGLHEGVQFLEVLEEHIKTCFARSGFPVENVGVGFRVGDSTPSIQTYPVILEAQVRSFWTEFMPGIFVVDASSHVQIEIAFLNAATEREVWAESFSGEGEVSSGFGITRAMFERSLNAAYRQAIHKMHAALLSEEVRDIVRRQNLSQAP